MEIRVLGLVLLLVSGAALRAEAQTWGDFKKKHVDRNMDRKRCNEEIEARFINPPGTCKSTNSFIRAKDTQVVSVCRGAGNNLGGNLYESKTRFTVVTCKRTQTKPCRYEGSVNPLFVTVECKEDFPVRYVKERPYTRATNVG